MSWYGLLAAVMTGLTLLVADGCVVRFQLWRATRRLERADRRLEAAQDDLLLLVEELRMRREGLLD